jgi:hypothetical protein
MQYILGQYLPLYLNSLNRCAAGGTVLLARQGTVDLESDESDTYSCRRRALTNQYLPY